MFWFGRFFGLEFTPMPLQVYNTLTRRKEPFEPLHPDRFARDLASRINELMADPVKCAAFGKAGRRRAAEVFSWASIARQTRDLYETLAVR